MDKIFDVVGMGFLNKLAGAILGFIKGVIFASIILFIVYSVDKKSEMDHTGKTKKGSYTMDKVENVFPRIMSFLGSEIKFPFKTELP